MLLKILGPQQRTVEITSSPLLLVAPAAAHIRGHDLRLHAAAAHVCAQVQQPSFVICVSRLLLQRGAPAHNATQPDTASMFDGRQRNDLKKTNRIIFSLGLECWLMPGEWVSQTADSDSDDSPVAGATVVYYYYYY